MLFEINKGKLKLNSSISTGRTGVLGCTPSTSLVAYLARSSFHSQLKMSKKIEKSRKPEKNNQKNRTVIKNRLKFWKNRIKVEPKNLKKLSQIGKSRAKPKKWDKPVWTGFCPKKPNKNQSVWTGFGLVLVFFKKKFSLLIFFR